MVQEIEHSYPSQLAVRAIAHAASAAQPLSLLHRSLLVSHILRAYLRHEWEFNRERHEGYTLEDSGRILNNWRKFPLETTFYGKERSDALTFLDNCREYLKNAYRLAAKEGRDASANIAGLGLTFLFTAAHDDRRASELSNKANIYYPVYETNPFLSLGIAREVLRDVDAESYFKHGKYFTGNIYYDPLTNIEKFYNQTSNLQHYLNPHTAPTDKTDDAVKHLADLADKIGKFTEKDFNHRINGPDQDFRDNEGVSLRILAHYLAPYLQARSSVIQAQTKAENKEGFKLLDFSSFAAQARKPKDDKIIRNVPAIIPEPVI